MAEDILHQERVTTNNATLELSESTYNEALILLEDKCLATLIQSGTDVHDQDLRQEMEYKIFCQ